jgi:hypothetical protein
MHDIWYQYGFDEAAVIFKLQKMAAWIMILLSLTRKTAVV